MKKEITERNAAEEVEDEETFEKVKGFPEAE